MSSAMLNIAVKAARRAGEIIARSVDMIESLDVVTKTPNDFVSEVDRRAEAEIINILRKAFPDHSYLAEESGIIDGNEYQWIIDPLDGTTNFLHGFPQFSVSIALTFRGNIELGVVYDPIRDELFTAVRGSGAQLNNRRIRVTNRRGLDGALLGTGFPFKDMRHIDAYLATFKSLVGKTAGIRRPGSAALDLAYVAAGRLDGFWEIGLSPWDMAAGILIIKEAGGLVSDFSGGHEYLETGNVVAGSPKVFHAMLQSIQPHLTDDLKK